MTQSTFSAQTQRDIALFERACAQVERFQAANGLPGRIDHRFMGTAGYHDDPDFRIPSFEINLALDSVEQMRQWDRITRPWQLQCYNGLRGHPAALPITDDEEYLLMWHSSALDLIGGQPAGAQEPILEGWTLYVRCWPHGRTVVQYPDSTLDLIPRGNTLKIPLRRGRKPQTTATVPHLQCTDVSPPALREELMTWFRTAPLFGDNRQIGPSEVAEPTSIGLFLGDIRNAHGGYGLAPSPRGRGYEAFHIHEDGGGHLVLSPQDRWELIVKGWGEPHPGARWGIPAVLFYGPRNRAELEIVKQILTASYHYAIGLTVE